MAAKKILLVEGIDDKHVLMHLCGTRNVPRLDDIIEHGGVDQLLESFPVRLKASAYGDIIGVVIDADIDLSLRWHSLRNQLVQFEYQNVPQYPLPDGTILNPPTNTSKPRVGIWIMPDNQHQGILEDFLRFLVPAESRLFDHVQSSIAAIPPDEVRFSQLAKPKALIHTWLAWQKEPGKPLGTAITARYLDCEAAQVDTLISWLNRLYYP